MFGKRILWGSSSDIAKVFQGRWAAHTEDQNAKENEDLSKMRKLQQRKKIGNILIFPTCVGEAG